MNSKIFALLIVTFSLISFILPKDDLVKYIWKLGNITRGTINVPVNYKESNLFYGEGIITTLTYQDSSTIVLHFGSNMTIPFCDGSEFIATDSSYVNHIKIRSGYNIKNKSVWRECNYPLYNIMYYSVPSENKELFNLVLNSFTDKLR